MALGLPPVAVTALPATIPVVLPRGHAALDWRVALEDGGVARGRAEATALGLLECTERDGRMLERRSLTLGGSLPLGYHRVSIDGLGGAAGLIVTPAACYIPPAVAAGEQLGGIAIQLYLLRSGQNWGIGDFGDLRTFVELVAARGADVVGLNPLHAMFADNPEHASPYSPASRILLNVLNIDVAAVPEFAKSYAARARLAEPPVAAALAACGSAEWVDYSAVSALKLEILGLLREAFAAEAEPDRQAAFAAFRAAATPAQERTYTFLALREWFAARDPELAAWQRWPAARQTRATDRAAFLTALRAAGLLVAGDRPDSDALFIAAHEFLARSGAALVIAQIDDITAEIEPVNVPTTAGERPNWRRRLSRSVEQLADDPRFAQTFAIFARARRTRLSIG